MTDLASLKREEVQVFIQEHLNQDIEKLLLNPPKEFKEHIKSIAEQIYSRKKAKGKLANWYENKRLIFPSPLSIEQSSSDETSSYKASLIKGELFVDLTGGMGIDCLAISENFKSSTYVEKDLILCQVFGHNSRVLNKSINIVNKTAEEFLMTHTRKSIFYLDPARRDINKNKVIKLEDCSPNLQELMDALSKWGEQVLVKLSPMLDISYLTRVIKHIKEIHIVSVKNDCKEILLLIDFQYNGQIKVVASNLGSKQSNFEYELEDETVATSQLGKLSNFLYEPNASVLKAGAFNKISEAYDLPKLSKNSHLYTSGSIRSGFPGKVFKVVEKDAKKCLNKYLESNCINVLTRNYPLTPAQIKKKYKVKDGGSYYLIGFADASNIPQLIIGERFDL